jgi:hypothetical protein
MRWRRRPTIVEGPPTDSARRLVGRRPRRSRQLRPLTALCSTSSDVFMLLPDTYRSRRCQVALAKKDCFRGLPPAFHGDRTHGTRRSRRGATPPKPVSWSTVENTAASYARQLSVAAHRVARGVVGWLTSSLNSCAPPMRSPPRSTQPTRAGRRRRGMKSRNNGYFRSVERTDVEFAGRPRGLVNRRGAA